MDRGSLDISRPCSCPYLHLGTHACVYMTHGCGKGCFSSLQWGFPGRAEVESPPANSGDTGSSSGLGGSHIPWSS